MNDNKLKLKCILEAKKISRSGIDNAHLKLKEWKKIRKKLKKEGKDLTYINIKIQTLNDEITLIEDNSANMEFSGCVNGGVGFGSGGGSGTDAG